MSTNYRSIFLLLACVATQQIALGMWGGGEGQTPSIGSKIVELYTNTTNVIGGARDRAIAAYKKNVKNKEDKRIAVKDLVFKTDLNSHPAFVKQVPFSLVPTLISDWPSGFTTEETTEGPFILGQQGLLDKISDKGALPVAIFSNVFLAKLSKSATKYDSKLSVVVKNRDLHAIRLPDEDLEFSKVDLEPGQLRFVTGLNAICSSGNVVVVANFCQKRSREFSALVDTFSKDERLSGYIPGLVNALVYKKQQSDRNPLDEVLALSGLTSKRLKALNFESDQLMKNYAIKLTASRKIQLNRISKTSLAKSKLKATQEKNLRILEQNQNSNQNK
ncbi:hypothetical protein HOH54_02110 [bacterium]|nr:hypothetical protein [bacterium]